MCVGARARACVCVYVRQKIYVLYVMYFKEEIGMIF